MTERETAAAETLIRDRLGVRSIVLVGIMGAGKSTVGRRLAARLGLRFVDADSEIEAAAQYTVAEIFDQFGEEYFRDGERRVIARLLGEGQQVLATGGGAYMNAETRDNIRAAGVSVWLKADLDTLLARVKRRNTRPLLKDTDPEQVMRRLIDERYPIYADADIAVQSRDAPHEQVVDEIVVALAAWLDAEAAGPAAGETEASA
ncbi:MAG: shikimate kinase [Hyphomicrobiales bacterium]|nr:shikimate kinase [Hyphomicrobiales bacterium]